MATSSLNEMTKYNKKPKLHVATTVKKYLFKLTVLSTVLRHF